MQELPTCGNVVTGKVVFVAVKTYFQLTLACVTESHTKLWS